MEIKYRKIETVLDRHGNECIIIEKTKNYGMSGIEKSYLVRYADSARYWLNKKTGAPYFKSANSAMKKILSN